MPERKLPRTEYVDSFEEAEQLKVSLKLRINAVFRLLEESVTAPFTTSKIIIDVENNQVRAQRLNKKSK